jgi:Fe-Mn family superoxide dismutase
VVDFPTGKLADKINQAFGSVDTFKQKFKEAALAQFGSGWLGLFKKMANSKSPKQQMPIYPWRMIKSDFNM